MVACRPRPTRRWGAATVCHQLWAFACGAQVSKFFTSHAARPRRNCPPLPRAVERGWAFPEASGRRPAHLGDQSRTSMIRRAAALSPTHPSCWTMRSARASLPAPGALQPEIAVEQQRERVGRLRRRRAGHTSRVATLSPAPRRAAGSARRRAATRLRRWPAMPPG